MSAAIGYAILRIINSVFEPESGDALIVAKVLDNLDAPHKNGVYQDGTVSVGGDGNFR